MSIILIKSSVYGIYWNSLWSIKSQTQRNNKGRLCNAYYINNDNLRWPVANPVNIILISTGEYWMLKPLVAMFFLTFVVWVVMYVQRFRYMAAQKIKPQQMATPEAIATLFPEWVNRPSDNLKNLFEMPVIFYAICAVALSIKLNDNLLIAMAWAFVVLRVIHSVIHCTGNNVLLRFFSYFVSSIVLFGMVVRFALLLS